VYSNFQVAVKTNVDVLYFAVVVPLHVYCVENGQMDKRDFLQLWKEIPEQNEVQFNVLNNLGLSAGKKRLVVT
jgi:AP-2 complex subunit beta-1